jgi:peptidyl-prolyl cis-trans isomerase D
MLSAIRALARSPIFGGFIIALLIAAFALFGVNDIFRGAGTAAVLVGDERVAVQDLARAYERQLFQIRLENPRFTDEQAEQVGLGDNMVRLLTTQAAIEAKSGELGIAVSDAQIADEIRSMGAFVNPFTNRFDADTYIRVLESQGYARGRAGQQFEAEMAKELRRQQFVAAILGGVQSPDIMTTARRAFEGERRTISALLIPPGLADDVGLPDDATLAEFITANPDIFTQAEQRRFTLVRFTPDLYTRDVEIPEDDLRALYEFRLANGELADPPTRSLTQWLAADEAAALAAVAAIEGGQSAQDLGLGEGIALEGVQAFEIPDSAIADAAFAMQAGEVRAVEGRLGWRVLQIQAAEDPETPDFETVRPALIEELSGDEALQNMMDAFSDFESARAEGFNFEEAGAAASVPVEHFDFVTARGATLRGEPAATLAPTPEIVAAVFDAPENFETDAVNYQDNGYFMIRVDEIIPQRLPEVDEVREFATAVWRVQEIAAQLDAIAADAISRVRAGESLNAVAATIDGAVVESSILGRGETVGLFGDRLVQAAFAAPQDRAFEAIGSDQSTRMIVMVTDILAPPLAGIDPVGQAAMSQELSNDLALALESALLASYEIRADQTLIDLALGRVDPDDIP